MPRIKQYLDYVEDLRSLSIKDIKRYLKANTHSDNGVLSYYRGGERTGSIGIESQIFNNEGIIILSYKYRQELNIRYEIQLISKPSNLGKGIVWYFVCPKTEKICRTLHLKDGYYYHRSAFSELYYENQVLSKNWRKVQKAMEIELSEKVFEEYYKKHRKKTYRGIPTKEESKLKRLISIKEEYIPDLSILDFMIDRK
ncbi:hypothetical protein ASG31_17735 [Chryseobacterium sp. Leaf404]|uniref:hypothetical protein n=1 Tax=unclassified Chryseobacterium TaxID=2593645 RepID=UPI0006FF4E5A|nr:MULTISPECIES: hypothetical protein [unclassified Chryseobacterium]KQT20270.1 hypothetical protein ASG31_17735 [Chryseobacterium sp. Leaf404]